MKLYINLYIKKNRKTSKKRKKRKKRKREKSVLRRPVEAQKMGVSEWKPPFKRWSQLSGLN